MKKILDRTPTADAFIQAKLLHCSFLMLGHKRFALVDHEDAKPMSENLWGMLPNGYATRRRKLRDGAGPNGIYMHRSLLDCDGMEVDHRNGVRNDNRKCNLRTCNDSQTQGNRRKTKKSTSSIYKGVSWSKEYQQWAVFGSEGGKSKNLGRFNHERDAAAAYNAWAAKKFGEFACLNQL